MSVPVPLNEPQVLQAVKDLARRLNLAVDQIAVLSVETVTWPDTSLGCPQPGMMYAQVLQAGMRILLSAEGHMYHYHSRGHNSPFLCENPVTESK